jgi:hypothetical protein
LQTTVAFLCTRVKCPDTDDYKKLAQGLKYLRATWDLPLTLEVDNLQIIKWWIDASYVVHPDIKSYICGIMSLVRGAIYATSAKQQLNTKVPPSQNWLVWLIFCHKFCGHVLVRHKDTE